jgi:hypothetical protein
MICVVAVFVAVIICKVIITPTTCVIDIQSRIGMQHESIYLHLKLQWTDDS